MTVSDIINSIDDALKKRIDTINCLSDSQFFGLVEPIVRREDDDKWFPVVVDNQGEDTYVFVDDDFPMGIYHRLIGKSYSVQQGKSFGDNTAMLINVDMLLVCWCFRDKINTTVDVIESMIFASSPKDITPVQSNFDRNNVFLNEFKGIPFFLPEEVFLFSMRYKASYPANKRECLNIETICN